MSRPSQKKYLAGLPLLCFPVLLYVAGTRSLIGQQPNAPVEQAQLDRGTTLKQELSKDSAKLLQIRLQAHEFTELLIDKGDLQMSVEVLDPEGKSITDQVSRAYEPIDLFFASQQAGVHQLVVRSLEKDEPVRSFTLTVKTVRNATEQDEKVIVASRATAEAVKLKLQWREDFLRAAIVKYKEAADLWLSAKRLEEIAKTLEAIGNIHFILSEYDQALDQYLKALSISRSIHDKTGEMRQLSRAGYVYVYSNPGPKAQHHTAQALKYFSRKRPTSTYGEEKREEAFALNGVGEAYYSQGELRVSIDYFKRALNTSKASNDRAGQALAHLNLGYSYLDMGNLAEARQHFREAISLYRTMNDPRGEALGLTAMGSVHSLIGEKQIALDLHTQAMNVLRTLGDHQGEAVALNSIGKVYEDLNDLARALENYNRALEIHQKRGNREFEPVTKYYLGRVYNSQGNKEQALLHFQQSLSQSQQLRQKRVAVYALSAISALSSSEGKEKEALSHLHRGLSLYRELGDRRGEAISLNAIGNIYRSRGDNSKALYFYEKALPLCRAAADRKGETDTLYNIARATSDAGDLEHALSLLDESIRIIEKLRSQVVSPELRASYFASVSNHWELRIDILMKLHQLYPQKGFDTQAFQASENARARALIEVLAEVGAHIRQGVNLQLLQHERSLKQQMAAKAAYHMRLLSGKPAEAEIKEAEEEIRRLSDEYEQVQTQIKQQSPEFAALVHPQPLKLDEIQAQLHDDDALLQFQLGEEKSYLWLVTRTSLTAHELPSRAKIEAAAMTLYKLLTARESLDQKDLERFQQSAAESDATYWKEATVLSQTLLGPVASQLPSKRLIIVPDGALQYLPFGALPSPNSTNPQDNTPLVVHHDVVNLPSASVLAVIRRTGRSARITKGLVAILADPVFENDDPRLPTSSEVSTASEVKASEQFQPMRLRDVGVLNGENRISRLPATRQEAEAIIGVTPRGMQKLAIDFEASRATAMSDELGGYSVVHFATHGIIDTAHPQSSGILLSLLNREGQPEDGFLHVHDVYNLNLSHTDLVVLSACRTALGKEIRGEGMVGLTRGFMYAGTKSIVASLWKVDDRATAELMKHFYSGMFQEKLTPAAALRKAKMTMMSQPRWRAPYFWAAFTLQGEYRDRIDVPPAARFNVYTLIIPLLAATALLAAIAWIKFRRVKP